MPVEPMVWPRVLRPGPTIGPLPDPRSRARGTASGAIVGGAVDELVFGRGVGLPAGDLALPTLIQAGGRVGERGAEEQHRDARADEGREDRRQPPELAEDREEEPQDGQRDEERQQAQHGVDEEGGGLLHPFSLRSPLRAPAVTPESEAREGDAPHDAPPRVFPQGPQQFVVRIEREVFAADGQGDRMPREGCLPAGPQHPGAQVVGLRHEVAVAPPHGSLHVGDAGREALDFGEGAVGAFRDRELADRPGLLTPVLPDEHAGERRPVRVEHPTEEGAPQGDRVATGPHRDHRRPAVPASVPAARPLCLLAVYPAERPEVELPDALPRRRREQAVAEPGETARMDGRGLQDAVVIGEGQHDVEAAGARSIHEDDPRGEVATGAILAEPAHREGAPSAALADVDALGVPALRPRAGGEPAQLDAALPTAPAHRAPHRVPRPPHPSIVADPESGSIRTIE
ncbi:unnamed protein product [Penicillium discolor]